MLKNLIEIKKEASNGQFSSMLDIIKEKLNTDEFRNQFSQEDLLWFDELLLTLPFIIRNKDLCRVLAKIYKKDAILRYQIACELKLHDMKVSRLTKQLEKLKIIHINGKCKTVFRGNPCYINRNLKLLIRFVLELAKSHHGNSFVEDSL